MDFFIKDDNVRPGNRGGRDQFKWDDVRMMNNKDRESYLGVSQSIGFLDKGGKWRKRDWWQTFKPDNKINMKKLNEERDKIKQEEEQMLMNAIYGGSASKPVSTNNDKKLTDFQWEKIMKKESKNVVSGNDINMYEYYDDDKHRAGLGVKTTVSFRTNPYDKGEDLGKLEGNVNEKEFKEKRKEIKVERKDNKASENSMLNKYIKEKVKKKKKNKSESRSESKKEHKHHKHHHHHRRERSRSNK